MFLLTFRLKSCFMIVNSLKMKHYPRAILCGQLFKAIYSARPIFIQLLSNEKVQKKHAETQCFTVSTNVQVQNPLSKWRRSTSDCVASRGGLQAGGRPLTHQLASIDCADIENVQRHLETTLGSFGSLNKRQMELA